MPSVELPDYEPLLASYHHAFGAELRAMIGELPIREGDRVLEMACGDGAYSPWLAERVGPSGIVVAVDVSPDYLRIAHDESTRSATAARIAHVAAPIERPPLPDDTFDLVWCAQSLYSLPDPLVAVASMGEPDAARRDGRRPRERHDPSAPPALEPRGRAGGPVGRASGLTARKAARPRNSTWAVVSSASSEEPGSRGSGRGRMRRPVRPRSARPSERSWSPISATSATGSPIVSTRRPGPDSSISSIRIRGPGMLNDPNFTMTCLDHLITGKRPG